MTNDTRIKFTIYFIASITVLGGAIIAPAMGAISQHFHDSDPTLVRLILTAPGLLVIPCCFLTSMACFRFGKRNVLLFSLFLYAISGCLGAFMPDVYSILFTRALLGVGVGLLTPISQSLPADFFTGAEKEKVVARASGSVSLGNCFFLPLSGMLASISWKLSFVSYGLIFIILFFAYSFLPKEFGVKKEITNITKESKDSIPLAVYFICFGMFAMLAVMYLLITNLAIIIADRELGSPASAGYALALSSACSFVVAFKLSWFRDTFKSYIYCLIPLAYSINYMLVYIADSMTTIYIAQIFNALAGGLFFPSYSLAIMKLVSPQRLVMAMSYGSCCTFLGSFFSPIIYSYLPNLPNHPGIAGHFYTTSIFCAFVSIVFVIGTSIVIKRKI